MRIPVAFRKRGKPRTTSARPIKDVLTDKAGAGVAEGMAGIALLLITFSSVAYGITGNMAAVQVLSVKAERQSLVISLVNDQRQGSTWGTPTAPKTQTMTTKNGQSAKVTLWREVTPTGTMLTAAAPISAGSDAVDCTGPSSTEKSGCLYAHRFHAADINAVNPDISIRSDTVNDGLDIVGTIITEVGTTTAISQGTVIAAGRDNQATALRYLVTARSVEATGEIRISQQGKVLAVIPVEQTTKNYFGTFSAEPNVDVTITVTQGNIVVQNVMTYRAGGSK